MKGDKEARNKIIKGRDGETRYHGEGSISGMAWCRACMFMTISVMSQEALISSFISVLDC